MNIPECHIINARNRVNNAVSSKATLKAHRPTREVNQALRDEAIRWLEEQRNKRAASKMA
jgi:hypothetical protein